MSYQYRQRVFCHNPAYGKPFYGFIVGENKLANGERFAVASFHGKYTPGMEVLRMDEAYLIARSDTSGALWHTPSDFRPLRSN